MVRSDEYLPYLPFDGSLERDKALHLTPLLGIYLELEISGKTALRHKGSIDMKSEHSVIVPLL